MSQTNESDYALTNFKHQSVVGRKSGTAFEQHLYLLVQTNVRKERVSQHL